MAIGQVLMVKPEESITISLLLVLGPNFCIIAHTCIQADCLDKCHLGIQLETIIMLNILIFGLIRIVGCFNTVVFAWVGTISFVVKNFGMCH